MYRLVTHVDGIVTATMNPSKVNSPKRSVSRPADKKQKKKVAPLVRLSAKAPLVRPRKPSARKTPVELRAKKNAEPAVGRAGGLSFEADTRFDEVVALIEAARARAYEAVNSELVSLYWQLGEYMSK